jgi:hypothetical protein
LLKFEWIPKYNPGGDRFLVKKMQKIGSFLRFLEKLK